MRTLVDYQKLDTDLIMKGFYDWLFEDDDGILKRYPIKEVKGNGVKYNVSTARGGASWTQPGDTISESTGTEAQRSAAISVLVGDADVDKSQIAAQGTQNVEVLEIRKKSADVLWEWQEQFIWGQTSSTSSTNQPKGLFLLLAEVESESTTDWDAPNNSQVVAGNAASGALTIDMMDELTDQVRPAPNAYIMSRRMRRKLGGLARAAGNNLEHDNDQLGYSVSLYGGVPIYINDHIGDNLPDSSAKVLSLAAFDKSTARAGGNDNSAIFAVRFSDDACCGIQTIPFTHESIGTVQDKDAVRHRFKWYTGNALYNKFAAAVLTGVLDTAL